MANYRDIQELERLEIEMFLEGIYRYYGFDFRDYAPASLRRRIWNSVEAEQVSTVTALLDKVLHDEVCMQRFLLAISVNVTAMFRDPTFYTVFRQRVVPMLRTYPSIQIWHAGCSTGEEVYSMAILLYEENLINRCTIYATDINEAVLEKAKAGIFPLGLMRDYTSNYMKSGGKGTFSDYYTAAYSETMMRPSLKERMVFAQHNLVTDKPFNEFHVILCRNVMIYFNKKLQDRVHNLFYDSLIMLGVLAVGLKETLQFTSHEAHYEVLDGEQRIYRKIS